MTRPGIETSVSWAIGEHSTHLSNGTLTITPHLGEESDKGNLPATHNYSGRKISKFYGISTIID